MNSKRHELNARMAGVGVFTNTGAFTNRVLRTPVDQHLRPRQPIKRTPGAGPVKGAGEPQESAAAADTSQRMCFYRRQHAQGNLQLLCGPCNARKGANECYPVPCDGDENEPF